MNRVVFCVSVALVTAFVSTMENKVKHFVGESVFLRDNLTVKTLEKEPQIGSMVVIENPEYNGGYQWAQVRSNITNYGFMIIYKQEGSVWKGNALRLADLYELVQKEEK